MPLEISQMIEISDPVYTFNEVVSSIDLSKYFVEKGSRMGRPRCDAYKMLKIILFAFMEGGYESLRQLQKLCKTDIRYIWILDGMKAPSFATFGKFIRDELNGKIEQIFQDINGYIFKAASVDLNHAYIDGTKIEANANRYTWIWKRTCISNRKKVFEKVTKLIDQMNFEVLFYLGFKISTREEYAIEYLEDVLKRYSCAVGLSPAGFVSGRGHRKSTEQKHYQEMEGYIARLKKYAEHIKICGDDRNSYSRTDRDATFMRLKKDYMGNDQLLPAYNMQIAVCDEFVAAATVEHFASDMDCFIPLMEKFHSYYGKYPEYPTADAGYGSYNNYLYCEEHHMQKYMKFPMFEKTVKDSSYRDDPFRAINFTKAEDGSLVCPGGKRFTHLKDRPVRGNKYGRTEELYICENCEGCPLRSQCCKKKQGNRVVQLNRELTQIHKEVLCNLESVHGALLRMNRSIQAEGVFGIIKWDRRYKRAFRRGMGSVVLEFMLIFCGFNLYKYHNKKQAAAEAA